MAGDRAARQDGGGKAARRAGKGTGGTTARRDGRGADGAAGGGVTGWAVSAGRRRAVEQAARAWDGPSRLACD